MQEPQRQSPSRFPESPSSDKTAIERLQVAISGLPQTQMVTRHYFADGTYCRELLIPQGVTLVGKVHKREHLCILLQGELTISDGESSRTLKAPCIFVSPPGVKRAGYAHEDSIFVNVHRTNSTDLDEIEREVIEQDPVALFDARNFLLEEA